MILVRQGNSDNLLRLLGLLYIVVVSDMFACCFVAPAIVNCRGHQWHKPIPKFLAMPSYILVCI